MNKTHGIKQICLMSLLGSALLLTGCTRHYTVTLQSGQQLSLMGKYKLVDGNYVFKDANGQPVRIPQGSVREIAPASMSSSRMNSGFKAEPMK